MVQENKWPADFGDHYNGIPRHIDMVRYCKAKGHTVSMSAMGRYAKQAQALADTYKKTNNVQKAKRIREYLLAHLGDICQDFANIQSDLINVAEHPHRNKPPVAIEPAEVELLRNERLAYLGQMLVDLGQLGIGQAKKTQQRAS